MTRGCVKIIRIWPPRRDEFLSVLIGAGGTWRSDWLSREKRSMARLQGHAAACTELLQTGKDKLIQKMLAIGVWSTSRPFCGLIQIPESSMIAYIGGFDKIR